MKIVLEFDSHEELVAYCQEVIVREQGQPHARLREWRVAKGWSQKQLGDALGYLPSGPDRGRGPGGCSAVCQIERGKQLPGRDVRQKIEDLTGIPSFAWRNAVGPASTRSRLDTRNPGEALADARRDRVEDQPAHSRPGEDVPAGDGEPLDDDPETVRKNG